MNSLFLFKSLARAKQTTANILIVVTLFMLYTHIACKEDPIDSPPKQEVHPIVGTWEGSHTNMHPPSKNTLYRITFFENGTYGNFIVRHGTYSDAYTDSNTWVPVAQDKLPQHWKINGDTLFFPDCVDYRTERSVDYTYSFSEDKNNLYLKIIPYPFLGEGPWTHEGIYPIGAMQGAMYRKRV